MVIFPKRFAPFVYIVWAALAVGFAVSGLWEVDLFIVAWIAIGLGVRAAQRRRR